jgi:hypothetical protein
LCAALLAGSAAASLANTFVTFNVDMTTSIANAQFDPATMTMAVRGSFNGWTGPVALTNNPLGATPAIYSQTVNIADNGSVVSYKYTIEPATTYEGVRLGGGHNRLITLPTTSGATFTAPLVYFGDVPPVGDITSTITFRVNMAQQINVGAFDPNTSIAYSRGSFNGYSIGNPMTNDPTILTTNQFGLVSSNVYVTSVDVTGSPGQTVDFKYYFDPAAIWESPTPGTGDPADNNNRFFNLPTNAASLAIIYFNDAVYAPKATNATTFQVDMTAQVLNGNFDPTVGTVELRGNFNNWGTPQILCTNNPAAPNTNIYSVVVPLVDGVGAREQYKFWATVPPNSGWETMADNRTVSIISGTAQTLPVVFFSNVDPNDLLPADTTVTFRVNMTNAVGTDSHAFDPASGDLVNINGVPSSFAAWDTSLPALSNNPVGSTNYSVDILVPKGSPVMQTYKYGINGNDDEAPAGNNHVRYIRQTGTYVMPLDKFGTQAVETSFGNLQASSSTPGHVLISWLGRPGVHLQTKSSITGSWTDHPETDGLSSTNWPSAGAPQFFRLIKP